MEFPEDLWYTKDGFWVRIEGDMATIGISEWLMDQMGQLVYGQYYEWGSDKNAILELQDVGGDIRKFYKTVAGETIIDGANHELLEAPVSVHNDPYNPKYWFYKLKLKDPASRTGLMTAAQFRSSVGQ